jgi:hypothetical protein
MNNTRGFHPHAPVKLQQACPKTLPTRRRRPTTARAALPTVAANDRSEPLAQGGLPVAQSDGEDTLERAGTLTARNGHTKQGSRDADKG